MPLSYPTPTQLTEVAAINNLYLGKGTMQLEPVTAEDFLDYLPGASDHHAMVVKVFNGQVLGYALVKPYSLRTGYQHACEHSVYLHPDATDRGYGNQLMHAIIDEARELSYDYIAAKIWANNQGSIRFHLRLGFQKVGIQRAIGSVDGKKINTMIMEALINELWEDEQWLSDHLNLQLLNHAHYKHEEYLHTLQRLKSPTTVSYVSLYLENTPAYEIELEDDIHSMPAHQASWVLAAIGTKEALQTIEYLATADHLRPIVRTEMQFRLSRLGQASELMKTNLPTVPYTDYETHLPQTGRHLLGHLTKDEQVVVYQAFKPAIAKYAVEHQLFGGPHYRHGRMTWIKPNFLWMMYRSGWATKPDQERVLAIYLNFSEFIKLVDQGVESSYSSEMTFSREEWSKKIATSEVRIQWDPDHDLDGRPLARKAIQIGLRGEALEQFHASITKIEDITPFVETQRLNRRTYGAKEVMVIKEEVL